MSDTNTNTAESQESTPTLDNFRYQQLVALKREPENIMDLFRAMNMGAAVADPEASVEWFKREPYLMDGLPPGVEIAFFERPYRTGGLPEDCEPTLVYVGPEEEVEVLRHLGQDPMTPEEARAVQSTIQDIMTVFDGYTQPEALQGESFDDYVDRTAYIGVGEYLQGLVAEQGEEAFPSDETIQTVSTGLADYLNDVILQAFVAANVPTHEPVVIGEGTDGVLVGDSDGDGVVDIASILGL